jgi:putative thioredoxin
MVGPHVIEVTDRDFEEAVVRRSQEVPVLVDFWAPWCGPCQILGPMLKKLAEEYGGRFVLASVNTDENPALAQAFRIQSIPTVHLVKDGKIEDGFTGALPESQLRDFLSRHVGSPEAGDAGDAGADGSAAKARSLLEAGRAEEAWTLVEALLAETPEDPKLRLLEARVALARGDAEAAGRALDAIPEDAEDEKREGERLRGALAFHAACGEGEAAHRASLEKDPGDVAARYALGCCLAAAGRYEEALEALLEVVKRDKTFEDGAARKAMVAVFGLLGPGNDLAGRFRKQLAIYL